MSLFKNKDDKKSKRERFDLDNSFLAKSTSHGFELDFNSMKGSKKFREQLDAADELAAL
jgi:hypothetical protein